MNMRNAGKKTAGRNIVHIIYCLVWNM